MKNDEHQLWQDERAADLRDRDRQREPHRYPRVIRRAVEIARQSAVTESVKLSCPACRGPVFAMSDARAVRLTCSTCGAQLSTHRSDLDGSIGLVVVGGEP